MTRLSWILVILAACAGERAPDAYGNFEAVEVVVSAQTTGEVLSFTPVEGMRIGRGAEVAVIDTAQLALEEQQLAAQRAAAGARTAEVGEQLQVLEVQLDVSRRSYERTRRLHEQRAATAAQLDQAERDLRSLTARIAAMRAQRRSVALDAASADARVAQVRDRIRRSRVTNPEAGTVLATYVRAGEVVQAGRPLYRIAALDTLELRVYVTGSQLASVRIGQQVGVGVDGAEGLQAIPGTVSWISTSAEFTPTPIQTREDRADLVYAVKIRVANADGMLKIGMPADVTLDGGRPAS
jgi:HlyD family secretion protein